MTSRLFQLFWAIQTAEVKSNYGGGGGKIPFEIDRMITLDSKLPVVAGNGEKACR